MKIIVNTFHNTECRSAIAGCTDLTDLDYYAEKDNPSRAKYARTRTTIIKKLCPHNGKNCSCWAMTKIAKGEK